MICEINFVAENLSFCKSKYISHDFLKGSSIQLVSEVTPRPRSGAEAGRTPCPKGGGQEELPQARGQGRQAGGATPRPRPGAVARRTNPTSKEPWLRRRSGA